MSAFILHSPISKRRAPSENESSLMFKKLNKFITEMSIVIRWISDRNRNTNKQAYYIYIAAECPSLTFNISIGGFPFEIETKISKLITYSLAIFMM